MTVDTSSGRKPTKRASTFDEHIPGSLSGHLKDLVELVGANVYRENFICAGVARLRLRLKASVAGTVKIRFMRNIPNKDIEYATNQPADVAFLGETETTVDIPLHYGEGRGYVEIIPTTTGALYYCDLMMT